VWVDVEEDLAELFADVRVETEEFRPNHLRLISLRGDRSGQAKRYRAKMTLAQRAAEAARHSAYRERKREETGKKKRTSPRSTPSVRARGKSNV
jgi:hypothetical protein